jgi:hypothetical protein
MRPVGLVIALAACGGGGGGGAQDIDACADCTPNPDAGVYTWRLEPRDATRIYQYEDDSAIAQGRSTRVAVEHGGLACDLWAMPDVVVKDADNTVTITPRVFARTPACTLTASQTRIVTVSGLTAGTWTVIGGGASTATPLTLTIGAAPGRACGVSPCTLDCDCDMAAGERCLGAMGFGGPFLACARPCEHNRDCWEGACVDIADGHFRTCLDGAECDDTGTNPCPPGYACTAGACAPSFVLNQGTRHECTSDQDCSGGLRCVEATAAAGASRCEVACRTGGNWCQGAHVCGTAAADLSSLARSDSVCGFLGE